MSKKKTIEIVECSIQDVNTAEYNPRKLSKKREREIRESLEKFGMIDPLIMNVNPERFNTLVGGHQRMKIWESMGHSTVPIVEVNLNYEDEKELNLRLNKNTGEFDYEKVIELKDYDSLIDIGFSMSELPKIETDFEEKFNEIDTTEPTYQIVPKFNESYNSVMIFCETELDYTWLKNVLGIERKKCYKSSTIGECRVLTVKDFQKIWKENEAKNS